MDFTKAMCKVTEKLYRKFVEQRVHKKNIYKVFIKLINSKVSRFLRHFKSLLYKIKASYKLFTLKKN